MICFSSLWAGIMTDILGIFLEEPIDGAMYAVRGLEKGLVVLSLDEF